MRSCLRPLAPLAFSVVALVVSGCLTGDEDIPATAAPTTTGIPIGAPGAIGARVEPPAIAAPPHEPRLDSLEEKINPDPHPGTGAEPVIPPSPFGNPPDDSDPPPATTKKKPKGTKI